MSLPHIVAWDPQLLTSEGRQPPQNNGCPEGYFAQFVGIGELGSTPVPGQTYALRCRLMASTTPETIVDESGTTMSEAIAIYTEAVKDTARQVKEAVSVGLPLVAIIVGGIAVLYLMGRR